MFILSQCSLIVIHELLHFPWPILFYMKKLFLLAFYSAKRQIKEEEKQRKEEEKLKKEEAKKQEEEEKKQQKEKLKNKFASYFVSKRREVEEEEDEDSGLFKQFRVRAYSLLSVGTMG